MLNVLFMLSFYIHDLWIEAYENKVATMQVCYSYYHAPHTVRIHQTGTCYFYSFLKDFISILNEKDIK